MKKTGILVLIFCMLLCLDIAVFAADKMVVFSEDIAFVEEEALKIPIKITNNSGIMGFKIHIDYPKDKITIFGAEPGDVIKQGSFSDNAGAAEGSMDVLWTGVSDEVSDGVLFYLLLRPKEVIQSDVILQLSYSQGDTFNENWEDVILDCKSITLLASHVEADTEITDMEMEEPSGTETANISTEYVIKDADKYVEEKTIVEFVEDADCSLNASEVYALIEENLEKNSITSFQDSNVKAAETAADTILSTLEKEGITAAATIKTYKPEQKIEAVETLYIQLCEELDEASEEVKAEKAKENSIEKNSTNEQNTWIRLLICMLLCVSVITVVLYKKKNNGRESK